ncbi:MAG: hypothetical protein ACPGO3_03820 [Magnetospiraceae bacterium]
MIITVLRRLFLASLALFALPAQAEIAGRKTVYLHPVSGDPLAIGTVTLVRDGAGWTFDVALAPEKFEDHFLSMRPFKCLEGDTRYLCHLPYPYAKGQRITANDLTDLEYEFLFIWKAPTDYGIDMWNGVYYRLALAQDRLIGRVHEVNMDLLASPPEDRTTRPITEGDLEPGEPASHWLPMLTIE